MKEAIYIQHSNDDGKTFSEPVRINDIEGSLQLDAQWSPLSLGIGTILKYMLHGIMQIIPILTNFHMVN